MAKYIIDVPDNTQWIQWMNVSEKDGSAYFDYKAPEDLRPYVRSESYIDGLKKGQNEVWEFARKIICPSDCCEDSISAHTKEIFNKEGWEIRGIFKDLSYQEAKTKYNEWRKQKDEIHVGDEVQYSLAGYEYTFIVFEKENDVLYGMRTDKVNIDDIYETWDYCNKSDSTLKKTGRYFPEVAELLKRIKKGVV